MTQDQILLLILGLPLAVLGMGIRRSIGGVRFLLLLLSALVVGAYAIGLDLVLQHFALVPPAPAEAGRGLLRGFGPMALSLGLVGALGAALLRHRGTGSPSS